jgi:hypothetical protein
MWESGWFWEIKVNAEFESGPEFTSDARVRFELLLTAMNDMLDLRQYIRDEQVASVKIVMLEELISVMSKVKYYLDSLEGWSLTALIRLASAGENG